MIYFCHWFLMDDKLFLAYLTWSPYLQVQGMCNQNIIYSNVDLGSTEQNSFSIEDFSKLKIECPAQRLAPLPSLAGGQPMGGEFSGERVPSQWPPPAHVTAAPGVPPTQPTWRR